MGLAFAFVLNPFLNHTREQLIGTHRNHTHTHPVSRVELFKPGSHSFRALDKSPAPARQSNTFWCCSQFAVRGLVHLGTSRRVLVACVGFVIRFRCTFSTADCFPMCFPISHVNWPCNFQPARTSKPGTGPHFPRSSSIAIKQAQVDRAGQGALGVLGSRQL